MCVCCWRLQNKLKWQRAIGGTISVCLIYKYINYAFLSFCSSVSVSRLLHFYSFLLLRLRTQEASLRSCHRRGESRRAKSCVVSVVCGPRMTNAHFLLQKLTNQIKQGKNQHPPFILRMQTTTHFYRHDYYYRYRYTRTLYTSLLSSKHTSPLANDLAHTHAPTHPPTTLN